MMKTHASNVKTTNIKEKPTSAKDVILPQPEAA
jgi:hypothetical protein